MNSKKLLQVYRVVGPDEKGFYFTDVLHKMNKEIGYDTGCPSSEHPMPCDDGIEDFPSSYRFGFNSLRQLKAWFNPKILTVAASNGCKVEIWEVNKKFVLGRRQMCFCPESATKVKSLPASHFMKQS